MSLCINTHCQKPQNLDDELFCQSCGSELLLQGRYRVIRQLGGGGFGLTFEITEVRSQIPKVLKVLINNQQKAVELFQQEAQVLSQLDHPGIPKVEQDGYFTYFPRNSQNPIHCLVMEKIVGMDLQKWMENRSLRPIDQTLAAQWLRELVTILHQVHIQNFFHRDIKPPNIMLRATGELALIDFGTARQVTQTYWLAQAQGQVTGIISSGFTPAEQMNGQAIPQSDFFALGRTLVYLLTGKQPTDSSIYNSYTDEIQWRNLVPNISPQLANLIDQMMARVPNQRPANTQAILQQLAEIEKSLQRSSPPLRPNPNPDPRPNQNQNQNQNQNLPTPDLSRRRIIKILGFGGLGLAGSALLYIFIPKTKSTLVVSSIGSGDYKTINEAIKNAQPGNTILVRPGLYQENLLVNKSIKIVGDGPREKIVIENTDSNCLILKAEEAEIRGLTINGLAGNKNKKFFAVDITEGKSILADCEITSNSLACIGIYGKTANPTIQQCQVHDGKSGGIYIYDRAQATLEECNVFNNAIMNVHIEDNSSALLQRCKIHDGKESGLVFRLNSQGTAEDCDIFGNGLANVAIGEDSNPLIQRCQIHDGKKAGVLAYKKSKGTVDSCNIFSNALSGVEIREGSTPVIRNCNINKNKYNAIYAYDQGGGTIENNDLTGNVRGAFDVDKTAKLQTIGNKVDPAPTATASPTATP
ncbi:pectinesterase family protein [Fortiea contorta]|uniref:pectinesterase family protein n=1 Tax=Fortiea contorta TaxID=1892405 RepID=UPI00037B3992|nr:pectinesterase family protein [Fortiea contorta]